jgi:hypothetical protein
MGLIYIDGSRVVTLYENGVIKEVLGDLVDGLRDELNTANQLNIAMQSNEELRQSNEAIRETNEIAREELKQKVETETLIVYKSAVSTFSDLTNNYSSPEVGWTVQTTSTKKRYRFNGSTWVDLGTYLDTGDIVISNTPPIDNVGAKIWVDIS